jgi:hypothetical protein
VSEADDREPPVPAEPEARPPLPSTPEPIEWPRCGYCGSLALRESRRGGLTESCLRLAGCVLYRCENCERRFAFATLGHPLRPHHGQRVRLADKSLHELDVRVVSGGRRRAMRLLATLLAALVTFLAASWLISRSERKRLEGGPTLPEETPRPQ